MLKGHFLSIRVPVSQRVLGDDHFLNVRSALDDLIGLGVAVVALHRKLRGIAVGAENFHRRVGREACLRRVLVHACLL